MSVNTNNFYSLNLMTFELVKLSSANKPTKNPLLINYSNNSIFKIGGIKDD